MALSYRVSISTFPNIPQFIMLKLVFLFLMFLSSCSHAWSQIREDNVPPSDEKNKSIVYNFLWAFEIDPEKNPLTAPLIEIQKSCEGKDFLDYRNCFLDAMKERREEIVHTSEQEEFISLFSESLTREIEYYPYYQKLAEMRYPEKDVYLGESDCFIVGTGSFSTEYDGNVSGSIGIKLSYTSANRGNLIRTFPSWKDALKYDSTSFTGNYFDPDHPCLYRTFGPAYGNIIFTETVWDDLYIFIKVGEWAGSGEFDYSIFVYNMRTQNYKHIGSFWAWSGIVPFEYNLNLEKQKIWPIDLHKNQPFLSYSIFEKRRVYGDTVESLLVKFMK